MVWSEIQSGSLAVCKTVMLPSPAVINSCHNSGLVSSCESVDASVVCGGQDQPHVLFLRTPSTLYFEIEGLTFAWNVPVWLGWPANVLASLS